VVLAAVTREGEEASLLAAWRALTAARPLLVVVPRHPQRFEAVAALIAEAGFGLSRRSAWRDSPPRDAGAADVWLGDFDARDADWYALADVALLGGSFEPLGGQNLIEAAACGCPVVMGPHTFNFADAAELALAAGAGDPGRDPGRGRRPRAGRWSGRDDERRQRGAAGLAFAAAHRGAGRAHGRGHPAPPARRLSAQPRSSCSGLTLALSGRPRPSRLREAICR
jgi:3-deoxy-D-manno-octulosonic-acid transferase